MTSGHAGCGSQQATASRREQEASRHSFQSCISLESSSRSFITFHTTHFSGKQTLDAGGIEGSTHGLSVIGATSEALHHAQEVFAAEEVEELYDQDIVPVITKCYDMTPSRIHFGQLQSRLVPVARYAVEEDGRWRAVSYDDYLKAHPARAYPRRCLLFLTDAFEPQMPLPQNRTCKVVSPASPHGQDISRVELSEKNLLLFLRPQEGNAFFVNKKQSAHLPSRRSYDIMGR